jgi:hypothetical protein
MSHHLIVALGVLGFLAVFGVLAVVYMAADLADLIRSLDAEDELDALWADNGEYVREWTLVKSEPRDAA